MMSPTPDILTRIIARKKQEISDAQAVISFDKMMDKAYANRSTRGFYQALKTRVDSQQNAVIAEIKKASPSKGVLRADFDAVAIAKSYEQGGAACLSVLTDKDFFQGSDEYLIAARAAVSIPVLRKEFIIQPYQIFESGAMGADCVLLIVACLDDRALEDLAMLSISLMMDVLVEVHNAEELKRALKLRLPMIGINNRDLHTFSVSLETTIELLAMIPEEMLVITESGILTAEDVIKMQQHGIYGYLVGEALMRAPNPGQALQEIFS